MSKIDDLLAEEGAAAESYEMPEELPGHITVSRPNLGRSTFSGTSATDPYTSSVGVGGADETRAEITIGSYRYGTTQ
jgi:hypothetical protein